VPNYESLEGATSMLMRHGSGDQWHKPAHGFASENQLEVLLKEYPDLLPWDLSPGLVVASQVYIAPDRIADLVVVGLSGEIVLVECKLSANSEIRRHIVGQIFAYASGLWHMPYDNFAAKWSSANGKPLLEAAKAVADLAGSEWNEQDFRDAVSANLEAGSFRLLVAVDQLTEELRGIVEYMNNHTVPELQLLAMQLEYGDDGAVQILLPTIYGQEAVRAKIATAVKGDREVELFEALQKSCSAEGVSAVRRLYDWALRNEMEPFWSPLAYPSFTAKCVVDGVAIEPFSIWPPPSSGRANVSVNFEYLAKPGFPQNRLLLEGFAAALENIPGFREKTVAARQAGFRRRPGILIDEVLANPGVIDAFGAALAQLVGKTWEPGGNGVT